MESDGWSAKCCGKETGDGAGERDAKSFWCYHKVLNGYWNVQGVIKDGKEGSRGMRFVFSRDTRTKVGLRLGQTRKQTD